MTMPLTESDKTTFTKYPPLPSKCVICLRGSDGELLFVDFQMSVDIYGAVVICTDCIIPIAHGLGFVEHDVYDDAATRVEKLLVENRKLTDENAKLNATFDSILNLRPNADLSSLPVNESTDSDSKDDDSGVALDSDESGDDDSESNESATGRRS